MDLVREASAHAAEAIRCDVQGAAGLATHHYRESICTLRLLLMAHPDTCFRLVYEAQCNSYRHRIDILEKRMVHGSTPI